MTRPDYLKRGEDARLFPVLSETQKEGRTLSSFLATLAAVVEFRTALLASIGRKLGKTSRFRALTEVAFKAEHESSKDRPDGLIVVTTGKTEWRALVEAKVGRTMLSPEQVERYATLAKAHGIDAVITVSNQFTPIPEHHPCPVPKRLERHVQVCHWSWMYVLTQAHLLCEKAAVEDTDQDHILRELLRFLSHPSAGVESFTSMNSEWRGVVETIRTGGRLLKNGDEVRNTLGAWFQETQDLALQLSGKLNVRVTVRMPRQHRNDPRLRLEDGIQRFCKDGALMVEFDVPDAAAPMSLCCDARTRTVAVSMRLAAAEDRKSTAARVNHVLRQMARSEEVDGLFLRAHWPGRARMTQCPVAQLREDPGAIQGENGRLVPLAFEVVHVREAGTRFSGPRSFIEEVEAVVPHFYRVAGQHLKQWTPPAPRVRGEDDAVRPVVEELRAAEAAEQGDATG